MKTCLMTLVNANQSHNEISLHIYKMTIIFKKKEKGAGKDEEKLEPSCIAGGNIKY